MINKLSLFMLILTNSILAMTHTSIFSNRSTTHFKSLYLLQMQCFGKKRQ